MKHMKQRPKTILRRALAGLLAGAALLTAALPAAAADAGPLQQLTSPVLLLMDADSRQILYQKNMDQQMYPASITKIMTALLTLENTDMDDVITMSYEATHSFDYGSSHIALDTGEQLSVENALYALMLPSANDAANGLAEHVGGTIDHFVELMNQRAAQLGAVNTHFANANGLHDPNHYTTARDIGLIACQAAQFPEFCTIWGTMQHDIPPTNKNVLRNLWSQVKMLNKDGRYYYDLCTGGKMGWTPEAKNTGVLMAQQDGRRLLCVIMGDTTARQLFTDARSLFDYGFAHLQPQQRDVLSVGRQTVTAYDESGQAAGQMVYETEASYLLDDTVDPQSVQVQWTLPDRPQMGSAEGAQATLLLPEDNAAGQYTVLGVFPARVASQSYFADQQQTPARPWWKSALRVAGFTLLGLAGAFGLFLLGCRIYWGLRLRRRRRARSAARPGSALPARASRAAAKPNPGVQPDPASQNHKPGPSGPAKQGAD